MDKKKHHHGLTPVYVLERIQTLGLDFKGEGFGLYLPQNAWEWLNYCILSLRTKDEVSQAAYQRLAAAVGPPDNLLNFSDQQIASYIYPCGFYQRKATQLKKIAQILIAEYAGEPPKTKEALLSLPGVGLKTANFVLSRGYGIPAICVDIHVHRISQRLGWMQTKTPDETEQVLCDIVPKEYWIPLNSLIVPFGQHICRPTHPHCGACPFDQTCPKILFNADRAAKN
ncbi:MAG: endonuclease III domain-containing protein [Spirochaetia bacterium]